MSTEGTADSQSKPEPAVAAPRGQTPSTQPQASPRAQRPGRVVGIDGIVFQCDVDHPISSLFIRPIEELSVRFRGRPRRAGSWGVPLANHAGIRVRIDGANGQVYPYVVEQQAGTLVQNGNKAPSWNPRPEIKIR